MTEAKNVDAQLQHTDTKNSESNTHPLWQAVRIVADFPKAGIEFFDISVLLRDHVNELIDALLDALPAEVLAEADYFVGIESRGFLFASLLAGRTGKGVLMIRKPNKLPPPVISRSYSLEYGTDTLEIQTHHAPSKVILVDDVLATGGTLKMAFELCQQVEHQTLASLVLIDIKALHGTMPTPVYTVMTA